MRKLPSPRLPMTIPALIFVIFSTIDHRLAAANPLLQELTGHTRKFMNISADPCEDFDNYACGNWGNLFPPQTRDGIRSLMDLVESLLLNDIANLFGDNPPVPLGDGSRIWARDYFRACMSPDVQRDIVFLEEILKHIGGWTITQNTNFDPDRWNHRHALTTAQNYYGFDTLFSWRLGDWEETTGCRLIVLTPPLGQERLEKEAEIIRSEWASWINRVLFDTLGIPDESMLSEKNELINTGSLISSFISEQEIERTITVEELNLRYPFLNWVKFFGDAFGLNDEDMKTALVKVTDSKYFTELSNLIITMNSREGKKNLANYIGFKISHIIQTESYRPIGYLQQEDSQNQTISCGAETFKAFTWSITAMLMERHFSARAREHAEEILDYAKKVLLDFMSTSLWMDEKTYGRLREKFKAMGSVFVVNESTIIEEDHLAEYTSVFLRQPSSFLEISLRISMIATNRHKNNFLKPDPTTHDTFEMNAFMNIKTNVLTVMLGQLVTPQFHPDYPRSVNFGNLGYTLGHELIHSFDTRGRNFYLNENETCWWTEETFGKFLTLHREAIKLQKNSSYESISSIRLWLWEVFHENMADMGGLKTAFLAYRAWLDKNKEDVRLSTLGLNYEQTFFLKVAQTYCSIRTNEEEAEFIGETHPPNSFRILNMMSNSREFAQTFNCADGTRYNPVMKSKIFWTAYDRDGSVSA